MSGITIRQAVTLGLNLLNEDPKLADSSKEIRYRVWWAIATTERALGVMTGRPTSFNLTDCSAPLPVPLEEESFMFKKEPYDAPAVRLLRRLSTGESGSTDMSASTPPSGSSKVVQPVPSASSTLMNSPISADGKTVNPNNGLFFLYHTKLSVLVDDVLRHLYRPTVMEHSWAGVQAMMLRFQKKLQKWRSALPAVFDFAKDQRDQQFMHHRMCLGFSYYSTVIIINRPCLCKLDRKIPNETEKAREIDRTSAASCVLAARSLVDLLPDEPNVSWMYQVSPWWNMVHHLMQAVAVLMIEMSFRATHCPEMTDELLRAAQKPVGWLQSMSTEDIAAARAWRLSSELLGKVAPRIGRRIDDRLRWPMQVDDDMSMQDLFLASSSRSIPMSSGTANLADYETVTTWEPLMFTSYDDYLLGNDPSMGPRWNQPDHH